MPWRARSKAKIAQMVSVHVMAMRCAYHLANAEDIRPKAAQARCKQRRRFQGHAIAAMAVVGRPTGAPRFIIVLPRFVEHGHFGLHGAWMAGQQALVE